MCSGDASHPERLLDEVDKPMDHLPALENLLHLIARLGCTHKSGFAGSSAKERYIKSFKYLMELGLDPFHEVHKQRSAVVGFLLSGVMG
ncbi:hypothetical protein IFM47457_09565 [Aspergillus lentulus]|nr:hypothetical protein IFM47457_09565 [Aspergillus lentulus]